jgi:hypothetical protein
MALTVLFTMLSDRVVGQMDEAVVHLLRVVVHGSETDVALFVDPDREGVPVGYHDPLTDVKFTVQRHKGPLDVLLDHPSVALGSLDMVDDLIIVGHYLDASAPTLRARLN